jgi:hypothetical protein
VRRVSRTLVLLALLGLVVPLAQASAAGLGTQGDPFVITSLPTTITLDTVGPPSGETFSCGGFSQTFLWATYAPSVTETVVADTGGSSFDTVLQLDTVPAGFSGLQCSDDAADSGGLTSQVVWVLQAGTTYLFRVGDYYNAGGHAVLTVTNHQAISAAITTNPRPGDFIGGTVTCHPGTHAGLTVTAVVDGKSVPVSGVNSGCRADGQTIWITGLAAKKGHQYKVSATAAVTNNQFAQLGSATTTVSARVQAK